MEVSIKQKLTQRTKKQSLEQKEKQRDKTKITDAYSEIWQLLGMDNKVDWSSQTSKQKENTFSVKLNVLRQKTNSGREENQLYFVLRLRKFTASDVTQQ